MKHITKENNSGFTLIEVILSIAILSIVSVVVLRLFVTSHELNEKSRITDLASTVAVNHIESLRAYNAIDDFISDYPYIKKEGNAFKGTLLFDRNFEHNATEDQTLTILLEALPKEQGLYQVTVAITNELSAPIVSYRTKHYFSEEVQVK